MFHLHAHYHAGAPAVTQSGADAQAIGDGTLLRLIPQIIALLVQLGLIKLPAGTVSRDGEPSPTP
ncbi:hypothetical protein GobsT_31370 [Gemmata obscuriglobus]|uniref:Uncharacterized protein n=1 Tax=Gemmata obscuriglobus TaxID=114 RepID=A0A2Z3H6M0_9BACT|nr:hypothetical protein [Gemmata obscuriglobus]AWM38675.1 hypothetical protein C1280_17910 [Gemmata obscuriglobus]QEG28360.1 hypothetical protein GobsT_31370 [Gemmata obscuriglobus]VTS06257.1 unnamed protein product [Gemmata obscuriglobus UQM 2246]VTS08159.1 unnamed protein product [Gemmata obscuriglobus UQM 2246]